MSGGVWWAFILEQIRVESANIYMIDIWSKIQSFVLVGSINNVEWNMAHCFMGSSHICMN